MNRRQMIAQSLHKVERSEEGWAERHALTWRQSRNPATSRRDCAAAIVAAVDAIALYADAYSARFDSDISDDGVLGPAWQAWGDSIISLLNGESGGLDCGTVDGLIRRMGACSEV